MGKTTIEWTAIYNADGTVTPGYTFNPWWGCQRVSPGCQHCFAETLAHRYGYNVWGPAKTTERRTMSENYWRQPLRWNQAAEQAGVQARVFCGSMCDVFEDHLTNDRERERLWPLIETTPHLDWLLLTKRPENMIAMAPASWAGGWPKNIIAMTSVEDQGCADERIPHLLRVPAQRRGLSCEPLLGPVDLTEYFWSPPHGFIGSSLQNDIHWVIAGGESGHGARAMHPDWARLLRNQCQDTSTPYFFKQHGEYLHFSQRQSYNGPPLSLSKAHVEGPYTRVGKRAAGRLLDGVEHNAYPD